MTTYRTFCVFLSLAIAACSDDGGSSNSDTRLTNTAGNGGDAGQAGSRAGYAGGSPSPAAGAGGAPTAIDQGPVDERAFIPEGIEFKFIGTGKMGLEIIASTLRSDGFWLVTVQNAGPDLICDVRVPATFLDKAEQQLGVADARVKGFMYLADTPQSCLGTGEIGVGAMPAQAVAPMNVSGVRYVFYQFNGFVDEEPNKASSVAIENIVVQPSSQTANRVIGTLKNQGTSLIHYAEVYFFPVNANRRALAVGYAGTEKLDANSTWDFELSVDAPVKDYSIHVQFMSPEQVSP